MRGELRENERGNGLCGISRSKGRDALHVTPSRLCGTTENMAEEVPSKAVTMQIPPKKKKKKITSAMIH